MPTQLTPYLSFDGNCREAMETYARVLHGKVLVIMTNGGSPIAEHIPPGNEDRVLHAAIEFDGNQLFGGDGLVGGGPEMEYKKPTGTTLALSYDQVADAERVFNALSEGGKVTMPLGEAFWAERFGMLVDRYGTPWIVNGGPKQFS